MNREGDMRGDRDFDRGGSACRLNANMLRSWVAA
ncbi:hypothetical protein LMG28138_05557 [Pararobbsia alpina]|uniref:Uncharacterized protein n=1 Tax=Pararobbsia alpina TaxID=621374 RepID=A0A6S7C034_9BURK|nr:hypothetical protein LMG28138_05557 [Pararobbsia alpina]